jgi:hypothetical protein
VGGQLGGGLGPAQAHQGVHGGQEGAGEAPADEVRNQREILEELRMVEPWPYVSDSILAFLRTMRRGLRG